MNKKNVPISNSKRNGDGDSASATSSPKDHPTKTRPPGYSGGSGSNHRPIGAPEPGYKTALPKVNAGIADLAVLTAAALKHLAAGNSPPYLFRQPN